MLEQLKKDVCAANLELAARGVVIYTWGNVSGIDREKRLVVIKTSGVDYDGMTPEDMAQEILGDLGVEFTDTINTRFECNCSKERVSKVLYSLNTKDIMEMIDEGRPINVECHFCNTNYEFTTDELKELLK